MTKEELYSWMFSDIYKNIENFLIYKDGQVEFTSGVFYIICFVLFIIFIILMNIFENKDEEPVLIQGNTVDSASIITVIILGALIYYGDPFIKSFLLKSDNIYEWKSKTPIYLEKYLNENKEKNINKLSFLNDVLDSEGKIEYCISGQYKNKNCKKTYKESYKKEYIKYFKEVKNDIDKGKNKNPKDIELISSIYKYSPFIKKNKKKSNKYKKIAQKYSKIIKKKEKKIRKVEI